jgi:hypothetical protein
MSFNRETVEKFKKYEPDIIEINNSIMKIGELKIEVVDPRGGKIKQKPIWSLENYIQIAIHRVYDLANECTRAWSNEIPVVSFILLRAIYENTAYMYDLSRKILLYYEKNDYREMYKVIVNRLTGSKLGTNVHQITNVLTAIKTVTKEVPDFREFYDFISEFCHPNYCGMQGIYGKLDRENVRLFVDKKYGYNEETFFFILNGLTTSLGIFYISTKNLLNNIDELNEFYYKHQSLASN